MEYAIGRVLFINEKGIARVKVLGYQEENKWITTQTQLVEKFPRVGRVFAPFLGRDYPSIKPGDVIRFEYDENHVQSSKEDYDIYIIPKKGEGHTLTKSNRIYQLSLKEIYERKVLIPDNELCFFFLKQDETQFICGPINSKDSSPRIGKDVPARIFNTEEDVVCDTETGFYYLTCGIDDFTSKPEAFSVDCMTPKQLQEWLKGQLSEMDLKSMNNILKQIVEADEEGSSEFVVKQRCERVKNILGRFSLTWEELKKISNSPEFRDFINSTIQENIEVIQKEYAEVIENEKRRLQQDLEVIKDNLKNKKIELEAETEKLSAEFNNEKSRRNAEIEKLDESISAKSAELDDWQKEVENLEKKKNDIIDIIRVQAGIVNSPQAIPSAYATFPLEFIPRRNCAHKVTEDIQNVFFQRTVDALEIPMDFINKVLSEKLRDDSYFCYKTGDIRMGIVLAHALGNSVYQLCQPSPKWISFKEFWQESLSNIWESAHNNPDVWHFLLIENFNIALPECWGYPLWNLEEGKTTLIPLAENSVRPKNLRIIVTKAPCESEDNTHIGLPTQVDRYWDKINFPDNNPQVSLKRTWEIFIKNVNRLNQLNEEYYFPVK